MEGQHHHYIQQLQYQQQQQQLHVGVGVGVGIGAAAVAGATTVGVDPGDRFPQWSIQETKEFLNIRGDLDQNFMETKRNKLLWEVISTKMRDKGFIRSSEQCKCKWKNLVTRYKGCETMELEAMRQQFPFYNEMQSIFTARMQRMLWAEQEGASSSKKTKAPGQIMSSDEDEEDNNSDGENNKGRALQKKHNKANKKAKTTNTTNANIITNNNIYSIINSVKEMLEDFMKQQVEMEEQWREAVEAREEERRRVEMEWRQRMEALENERLVMEKRWREIDEQRKIREEARAEKRDALINALLNKIRREDSSNM